MSGDGDSGERSDQHLRALCDAMQAFTEASTDWPRLLRSIAERMVAILADGCAVCLFSENGQTLEVVEVHHRDRAIAEAVRRHTRAAPTAHPAGVASAVARTGHPVLLTTVDAETLARHFTPDMAAFLSKTDLRSILFLPLQASGITLGTLVLSRNGLGSRGFDDETTAMARALAESASLAISNAQLVESLRRELRERERAQEEAKRFMALAQQSRDLIGMAALDGTVLFVNEGGRKMLGIVAGDELTLARFHTDDGMKRAQVLKEHGYWEGEGQLRHFRTGELIPTHLRSFLIRDVEGNPLGYATVQTDMRDARRMEEHIRQMQKMEAVGRLAAGVAHDFNNMLSVILSYGSMVIEALPAGSVVRGEVEEIMNAGRRAAQLTHQLLAFSRQQVLEQRVADLNAIVAGIERMARRLLREDVQLTAVLEPAIGPVKVDVGQIEQVILNLAVNARDAMPAGGTLTIATGTAVVDDSGGGQGAQPVPPGRYVTLRVSDTGLGMDDATRTRIFEPFFTTKPLGMGTGLGLATVFGIVRQSGGHITVKSHLGEGTTFTVYLPLCDEDGGEVAPASGVAPMDARLDRGRETILLVEDEAQVRKLMGGILRRGGYHVLDAPSVNAALKASDDFDGRIDLLLTDVVMPKMSGPQLAQRLASKRPEAKVLYVSGYMDVQVMDLGLEFLRKPFTPEGLLKRVREVLEGRPAEAEGRREALRP